MRVGHVADSDKICRLRQALRKETARGNCPCTRLGQATRIVAGSLQAPGPFGADRADARPIIFARVNQAVLTDRMFRGDPVSLFLAPISQLQASLV